MNLVIDQGNTNVKFTFFEADEIIHKLIFQLNGINYNEVFEKEIENVIYSTVSGQDEKIKEKYSNILLFLTNRTPLPIINKYKSSTIGLDRIAALVGATEFFNNQNVLVIDIGSAITYDLINKNKEFYGGNISPGMKLRFKALNSYTKNLPYLEYKEIDFIFGQTTEDAILGGVINGILYEIESYIKRLSGLYRDLKIILTGGDSEIFAKKINYTIFANSNLVEIGLNKILKYNLGQNF